MGESIIKFPVEQHEQARQPSADTLLAREVYYDVALLLAQSLRNLKKYPDDDLDELDNCRNHDAILIDGKRGTGKSSVLVNLKIYLESSLNKDEKTGQVIINVDELLILKPVDPTLMENGDDLLLNIVVAALLRNKEVKKHLDCNEQQAEHFYHRLQCLSNALKGVQTHGENYGMDRLRSFMGNHGLGQEVHQLFKAALKLTDKKLIVLPIDDVDTSLEHAFTNIEVIRKYLASPYAIPLVSGDLTLYDEVIWRNFHGRLVKDSNHEQDVTSKSKAQKLSMEYQQKVLPLPRRIDMPDVTDYLKNPQIRLSSSDKTEFSLPLSDYYHWLEAILNQQVNGIENSYLRLPVESTRELAQLVASTRLEIIEHFPAVIGNRLDSKRLMVMTNKVAGIIPLFGVKYNTAADLASLGKRATNRKLAYEYLESEVNNNKNGIEIWTTSPLWSDALMQHFMHKPNAGAAYLVIQANDYWQKSQPDEDTIFNLPLFNPIEYSTNSIFERKHPLRMDWQPHIEDIINQSWIDQLPKKTVLAYPNPELGRRMSAVASHCYVSLDGEELRDKEENENAEALHMNNIFSTEDEVKFYQFNKELEFMRQLMTYRSFYSRSNEANMVFCGRLFELVILSLIRDITVPEIGVILARPPFYSLTAFAKTNEKKSQVKSDETLFDEQINRRLDIDLQEIVDSINQWRAERLVKTPSAWLIYNVMNKFFNQQSTVNPVIENLKYARGSFLDMSIIAYRAFNCLLSAFGSFEKSDVFGLGSRIAFQDVNKDSSRFEYTDLFNLNVRPFTELPDELGSVTKSLNYHPLYKMLKDSYELLKKKNNQAEIRPVALNFSVQIMEHFKDKCGQVFKKVLIETAKENKWKIEQLPANLQYESELRELESAFNKIKDPNTPESLIILLFSKPEDPIFNGGGTYFKRLVAFIKRMNKQMAGDE